MNSFEYDAIFLEKLYRAEPTDLREKQVMDELKDALNKKYGTEIFMCRFAEEHEALSMFHPYKIILYSKSEEDLDKIKLGFQGYSEKCFDAVEQVFSNSEFGKNYPFEKVQVYHITFRNVAGRYCYATVNKEEYKKLDSEFFNPKTMEKLTTSTSLVVYKNKELLEAAKSSGEIQRIFNRCYEMVKKYDKYNVITKDSFRYYATSMEEVDENGGWFGFHHNVWG